MSKPTIRELIERAYERESGVVLAERVEAVLKLHREFGRDEISCEECDCRWPCATIRALNGEQP